MTIPHWPTLRKYSLRLQALSILQCDEVVRVGSRRFALQQTVRLNARPCTINVMNAFSRTSYCSPRTSYFSAITSYGRTITSYCSNITSYLLAIASYFSAITSYGRTLTSYCSPITSYLSAITSYRRTLTSFSHGAW